MKDYYALLGVDPKATKADIKKNYRLLANKYHPDKNSDPGASAVFIATTEAYDILSNKKSRLQYDLLRWQTLKNKQANKESFTTVVPPRQSTRSRRNQTQQKRSVKYHQAKGEVKETAFLIMESLFILSRHILLIFVITLLAVILTSVGTQLSSGIGLSIGIIVVLCILVVVILWSIIRIALHLYTEVKKDIALFSIYYKITHSKALQITIPVFCIVLIIYISILSSY